jgi:glycosyltransferase involved in cell wall biosynthesis
VLAADLAFALAAEGREVHAVTSRQRYDDASAGLAEFERVDGVAIHRVRTTRFGRAGIAGRALDYASFYAAATLKLVELARRGDVIVAETDPPLVSVCAALAARLRGAKLINWQQDVFPEVAVEYGFRWLAGPVGRPVRRLRDWSLRVAEANVALGERMAERLRAIVGPAHADRVHAIPNWAHGARVRPLPEESSPLRGEWNLSGFVAGYSGNLGRVHEIDTLVEACRLLKDDPGVSFVFIGGGAGRARLEHAVREYCLSNVRLLPYVDESRLAESLGACDVHLVSLLPAFEGLVVPSKFYGIAAAGRPTLYVGDRDGEIPRVLAKHDIGITVPIGDAEGLVRAILALRDDAPRRHAMGARAREVFEREWDRSIALARWRALLGKM